MTLLPPPNLAETRLIRQKLPNFVSWNVEKKVSESGPKQVPCGDLNHPDHLDFHPQEICWDYHGGTSSQDVAVPRSR